MLIDSHMHLQDIQEEKVRTGLLSRARELAVGKFVCNGTRPEDWATVAAIAKRDHRVIPFFGVHPWYAAKVVPGWDKDLENFLSGIPSGVGEIGLDKFRKEVDFPKQTDIFQRQLEMAAHRRVPAAIHCVRAEGALLEILGKMTVSLPPFMVHSYRGSLEMLREFLKLGAYISFSLKNLFRENEEVRAIVREVPEDRLLLETDFPYVRPHQMGTDVSEEAYSQNICGIYEAAARIRGITEVQLRESVRENGTAFLSGIIAR